MKIDRDNYQIAKYYLNKHIKTAIKHLTFAKNEVLANYLMRKIDNLEEYIIPSLVSIDCEAISNSEYNTIYKELILCCWDVRNYKRTGQLDMIE
jgi:hypothetical protein